MRTGRLYRSDDPLRITDRGRAVVEGLGLSVVVDLRQDEQFVRRPGFLPERTAHVAFVDQVIDRADPPRIDDEADLVDLYDDMLERGRGSIARAVDTIAAGLGSGPVLVHCAYGKDRAGLVVALVHAAIGVTADSIVADFARSHEPAMRRRAQSIAEPLHDDPDTSKVPEFLFSAHAATMRLLLDRVVHRHGSLETWVASFPIGPRSLELLRHELLEP